MRPLLKLTGSIAALVGVFVCAISGLARVFGMYYIAGYEATTIFSAGVGMMVFACLIKLEILAEQRNLE